MLGVIFANIIARREGVNIPYLILNGKFSKYQEKVLRERFPVNAGTNTITVTQTNDGYFILNKLTWDSGIARQGFREFMKYIRQHNIY